MPDRRALAAAARYSLQLSYYGDGLMKLNWQIVMLMLAATCAVSSLVAQTTAASNATTTTAAAAVPYLPSMSDLMNIGVQPRHIKLWMAGKEQNWVYAAYELSELRGAFARVGRTTPTYRTLDVPQVIVAYTQASMEALDQAIKAHDAKAFDKAYSELTASCNACHVGAEHSMVVIKVPNSSGFADQEFRAAKH